MTEAGEIGESTCPDCGHGNPPGARFCNQCGAAVATTAAGSEGVYTPGFTRENLRHQPLEATGERKQATVLFVDIAGSSRLAEQAGAEVWHEVLDHFFRILSGAVHKHGGSVNQYTGDGIMALFGAPVAIEEHARRTALAALEIRDAVRSFADGLRMQRGLNLSVRLGINSGEIIMGAIGDALRSDYTAQGHTVNLAARMESIAEPGHIYVTGETALALQGYFELRDLGAIQVHGIQAPVAVHDLVGRGDIVSRLELSAARGLSPFTGRDEELGVLLRRAETLRQQGTGGLILVEGQAGIGKSRLCHEFARAAEAEGLHVSSVGCPPFEQAQPYGPIQQLLRHYFEIEPGDSPARARRKVAGDMLAYGEAGSGELHLIYEFLGIADGATGAPRVAPEDRMSRLIELCDRALAGKEEPGIVLVDDLQWADAQSESFFRYLAGRTERLPMLLLYNQRPDSGHDWAREQADELISLGALSPQACVHLAQTLLGESDAMQTLAQRLGARAAGNPFYVEESVRELLDRGVLTGPPGARTLTTDEVPDLLPATVQAVLATRMDALDRATRRVLNVAAVLGHAIDETMLQSLCDAGADELEKLMDAGFLARSEQGQLGFPHPLVQEVAYDSQLRSTRETWHGRAARWLEQSFDDPAEANETAGQIARHWAQAGDLVQAAQWALQAASWFGQNDIRVAQSYFLRAAEWADAAENNKSALRSGILARAGLLRMASLMPADEQAVEAQWQAARAAADVLNADDVRAELEFSRALVQINRGRTDHALELVNSAMALSANASDTDVLSRFRLPVLNVYFIAGRIRQGLEVLERASPGEWAHGPVTQDNFLSRGLRALFVASQGDLKLALADLHAVLEVAQRLDQPMSWIQANLVDVMYLTRESANSAHYANQALSQAEEFGSPLFLALAWRAEATACYLRQDYSAALIALERGDDYVKYGRQGHAFRPLIDAMRAACRLKLGQEGRAVKDAQAAVDMAQERHADLWELRASLILADCLLAASEPPAKLEALSARVLVLIERSGAEFFRAPLALLRAEIQLLQNNRSAAVDCFTQAATLFERAGAPVRAQAATARIQTLGEI